MDNNKYLQLIKFEDVMFFHQSSLNQGKSPFFTGNYTPPLFDVGKKKPGHQLMFFGDSLFDQGKTSSFLAPFGIVPFPEPFYSKGKTSDGLVLGEKIAEQLGIIPDSIIPRELELLPSVTPPENNINIFENNLNYAYAGATTGFFGSVGNNLQNFPMGLLSQVEQFHEDFELLNQTPPYKNLIKKDLIHLDGIISSGSNDVFETLAEPNIGNLLAVLSTPDDNSDNQFLINQTADNIFNNIKDAINGNPEREIAGIGDRLNNIVIIGLISLGDIPFAIQVDQWVDQTIDELLGFELDLSGQTRDFLTGISAAVNTKLMDEFDNPLSDVKDVFVIDGFEIFENAQSVWRENLGDLNPISDISYLDYVLGNSNLPGGLSKEQFFFLDGSHPLKASNHLMASEITSQVLAEFPDFYFG
jgi:hypothetical protein